MSPRDEGGQGELTLRVARFDPELHISPIRLFRWLHDAREGHREAPRLWDVRKGGQPGSPAGVQMQGAEPCPDLFSAPLPPDRDMILIDDDGKEATPLARRLREQGVPGSERVRALYGGLELYDFALDPQVVGEERFLEP